MLVIHYSTLAPVRPRPLIIERQRKIRAIKKANRLQNIKNIILISIFVLCYIGAAWVDRSY